MDDTELIVAVRRMRQLVTTLDAVGYPVMELAKDDEISDIMSDDLHTKIIKTAKEVHVSLQDIEKSKRYKDAIKRVCNIGERP